MPCPEIRMLIYSVCRFDCMPIPAVPTAPRRQSTTLVDTTQASTKPASCRTVLLWLFPFPGLLATPGWCAFLGGCPFWGLKCRNPVCAFLGGSPFLGLKGRNPVLRKFLLEPHPCETSPGAALRAAAASAPRRAGVGGQLALHARAPRGALGRDIFSRRPRNIRQVS